MKRSVSLLGTLALITPFLLAMPASAQFNGNANVNPINGTGNSSTGWAQQLNVAANLSLSMMGQWNYPNYPGNPVAPANPSDGNGLFGSFTPGPKPGSMTKSTWNFWFDVNVDPGNFGGITLANRGLDFQLMWKAPGGSWSGPIDITLIPDNAYGNSSTPANGGIIGTYAAESGTYSQLQNAENISFSPFLGDINAQGLWDFALLAKDHATSALVDQLNMSVQVGVIPEPSTFALGGLGLAALVVARRRSATAS